MDRRSYGDGRGGGGGGLDPRRGQQYSYGGSHERGRQPYYPSHQGRNRERSRSRGPPGGSYGRRRHDEDYIVQTNYFKVKALDPSQREGCCWEYRATIQAAIQIKRDPDGNPLSIPRIVPKTKRNDNNELVPVKVSLEKGATRKSEDIMLALHRSLLVQDPPQYIAVRNCIVS